jgi:hypothetical protein
MSSDISQPEAAQLETALDTLQTLIGHGAHESQNQELTQAERDTWAKRVEEWMATMQTLTPGDSAAIRHVLAADAPILKKLIERSEQ